MASTTEQAGEKGTAASGCPVCCVILLPGHSPNTGHTVLRSCGLLSDLGRSEPGYISIVELLRLIREQAFLEFITH